jgi:hypothetical protein
MAEHRSELQHILHEKLLDPDVLARLREVVDEGEVGGHLSAAKAARMRKQIEGLERELEERADSE